MTDMRTAFADTTTRLLDTDPLAALVLADISTSMFEEAAARHPDRVINVGIRESLMVSVGGGLSLAGMHPIMHSYAPFLVERAFEQVKLDLGHQGGGGVLVSIGASFDSARSGRTHQSSEDIALLDSLPGITTYVPGHPDEVPAMLERAVGAPHTSYVRLSTEENRSAVGPVSDSLTPIRRGSRALVIAVGPMLDPVLDATRDMDVTVAYATTVRPLDGDGVRSLMVGDRIVLVEPYLAGTSSRQIGDAVGDRPHRTLALGVARTELRRYGTPADHAHRYELDAPGIRTNIDQFLAESPADARLTGAR